MKAKYLLGIACLLLTVTICASFILSGSSEFDLAKQQIVLRKIGHEVLLHAGDSTSRVLPIKKLSENEYKISFENEFTLQPDTLVAIVKELLGQNNFAHNYIVSAINCSGKDVVFGFAMLGNEKDNIIPCSGRLLPKSCYVIDLKFEKDGITAPQKCYLTGGLSALVFVGLFAFGRRKTKGEFALSTDTLKLGNMRFDANKRYLILGESIIALTVKESKLLLIFAASPNCIIERSRLQKEIWEDEGVIVGRSLDLFISKLRKKLESDPSVRLINIHGKGYKLEVNT